MKRLAALVLVLCSLIATSFGQEPSGNGVLMNVTERPIKVIVQPKEVGQASEATFVIDPARRLEFRKYSSYSVFLDEQQAVYDLDVPNRGEDNKPLRHYFYLEETDGKVSIGKGLPKRVFDQAAEVAEARVAETISRWTIRNGDTGLALSPSIVKRLKSEYYADVIQQQSGIEFIVLDGITSRFIVVRACDQLETMGRVCDRLQTDFTDDTVNPTKVVRLDCALDQALNYETVSELVGQFASEVKESPRIAIGDRVTNISLGEYAGLDGSDSELDNLCKDVRRFEALLADTNFQFVRAWESQLRQCLDIRASLLAGNSSLSENDLSEIQFALSDRSRDLYACACLSSDQADPQSRLYLGVFHSSPVNLRCEFNASGEVSKYYYEASLANDYNNDSLNITVEFSDEESGKIENLWVRPWGWCLLAKKTGLSYDDKWILVPAGQNGFYWHECQYCVRVKQNDELKVFDDFFAPRPNLTWIFSYNGWASR